MNNRKREKDKIAEGFILKTIFKAVTAYHACSLLKLCKHEKAGECSLHAGVFWLPSFSPSRWSTHYHFSKHNTPEDHNPKKICLPKCI